jgi:protein-disulfide isomerase
VDGEGAAEAAGVQGRFWDMHRLLFEHQHALEREDLVGYAEELGLDVERFTADLDGQRFRDGIRHAFLDGARSGVQGTPTFFVNGRRHDGAFDSDTLLDALTGSGPPLYGY